MEEDAIFGLAECMAQEQGEEYAEKCRGQNTPLFHAALDWEGVRLRSVVLNRARHNIIVVE
jgi:hypothetical protein